MAKAIEIISVKALGDWELEVLGIPYGGPNDGFDLDGEFFSAETELHLDKFPLPPIVYYHGYTPDGGPAGTPEYIGETLEVIRKDDGVWYRVLLDKTNELARRVWDAAKEGLARASSGTISHLARTADDGHILEWPVAELSIFDIGGERQAANAYAVAIPILKTVYKQAGLTLPDGIEADPKTQRSEGAPVSAPINSGFETAKIYQPTNRGNKMSEKQITQVELDAALAAGRAQVEAEIKAEADRQAEIDLAVETGIADAEAKRVAEAEAAAAEAKKKDDEKRKKEGRLPDAVDENGKKTPIPNFNKMVALKKYDNLSGADLAILIMVCKSADRAGISELSAPADEMAYKALAERVVIEKSPVSNYTKAYLKDVGFKANEIMYQSLSGFGDEWVGVEYSAQIWEAIREQTFVMQMLTNQIEVPPGHESIVLPLEGADPTFYKVPEATALRSDSGRPDATIPDSQAATGKKTLTLVKAGARIVWSGEMQEDSIIPFVSQLRTQLEKAGAEQLEHALIDGDTETGATTNINDIAGTPASTDLFLLVNGFRKSPLITTTANSRDGGALTISDYKETVKLMGAAGINALNTQAVSFITDINVGWKTLDLAELKTRDVFGRPTIEDGMVTGLYGYKVKVSPFMHFKDSDRLANTAGKIDVDTVSNNTKGAILAVRWDQWVLGWRRRMTMEVSRYPEADSNQIVALFRMGLNQRDTEASAITYNLSV